MSRREWSMAVAALASNIGMAAATSPQGPAFLPEVNANVVTLRTAGQPERRVQILKCERLPDGKILTEVKDVATGAIFTIADTKPIGMVDAPALPANQSLPVVAPAGQPVKMVADTSKLPAARPRNYDPLLGNNVPKPQSQPQVQPEFPTLVGKLKAIKSAVPANSGPQQSNISKALFGAYDAPPQAPATLVGKLPDRPLVTPAMKESVKTAMFGSPQPQTAEAPTLMGKLFGDKSAAQPTTQTVKHPTTNLIKPTTVANPVPPRIAPMLPPPKPEPVIAIPAVSAVPKPAIQQAESLAPISTDPRDPNFHVVPPRAMTMKQIEDMVKDLRMHHKPSARLEAANALATSPMAGMVEVRQILAEASYRDPIPVVRAHCIDLLTKMEYDEFNYRKYVEGLVNDEEPAVQRAARAAMR